MEDYEWTPCNAPVEVEFFFLRVGRFVIPTAVFGSLFDHGATYFPCTILIGILRSIRRACSRDSESLSFALTQRSLLPGWLSPS